MNSIKKVNALCEKILALTDADLKAVEDMANEQANYINPLKGATQARHNETGKYNLSVIADLRKLRTTISKGKL